MQQTTIRVSKKLIDILSKLKISNSETYEDVIWDVIEPYLDIKQEVKESLEEAMKDLERRETISFEELKEKYGF